MPFLKSTLKAGCKQTTLTICTVCKSHVATDRSIRTISFLGAISQCITQKTSKSSFIDLSVPCFLILFIRYLKHTEF